MRVLFVVPYAPTLIRTRPYNLLRALARRGHQLTLATLWETERERLALAELERQGMTVVAHPLTRLRGAANVAAAMTTRLPLQARYCWQPKLMRDLSRLLAHSPAAFDGIHVEHLRGAEYGRQLLRQLRQQGSQQLVVWDSVDCISLLFEQAAATSRRLISRWMARVELPRTRRYEGQAVSEFGRVLVTSAKDQAAMEVLAGFGGGGKSAKRVRVLPNGVDLDYFQPAPTSEPSDGVLFSGKMSYHANTTAALRLVNEIMPRVWAHRPATPVVLAGANPPRELQALAERNGPRVSLTGYVADLRPHFARVAVSAAPLTYGAGIQNKVLEAMACGVPVVVSPQALTALQAQPGTDLFVAGSDDEFAAALLQLLERPDRRRELSAAGRAYVTAHHDWDRIAARLEGAYSEAVWV